MYRFMRIIFFKYFEGIKCQSSIREDEIQKSISQN